ncbi:MAG: hypothetical protein IPM79_13955 [Polyangiaceae bacterium]|nr:hypothetical protein [Polyangiaceae bacterium]MBK8938700.1 hypothetical protein [Polyangiaceae bacterium]
MTQAATPPAVAAGARLVLRDVVARDASGLKGAARGILYGVSLDLGDTDVAVLGGIEDGTLALVEALVGRRAPDRGTIKVDGQAPFSSPELRRDIASFGVEPALPPARTVAASVGLATSAWERPVSFGEVLGPWSLEALASRAIASLTRSEVLAVEMALAFALRSPALVVAYEPFADTTMIPRARIEEALADRARRCPVIAITSRPADAKRFGRVIVLHRGTFARSTADAHAALAPVVPTYLTVWLSGGARQFASALANEAAASSVALDLTGEGAGVVRVTGGDPEGLALAIADAASASAATVTAVSEGAPGLAEIRAATELEVRSGQLAAQHRQALEARAQQQAAALYQHTPAGYAPPGFGYPGQVPFGAAAPLAPSAPPAVAAAPPAPSAPPAAAAPGEASPAEPLNPKEGT